jgi:cell shape-determining protein MreD
MNQIFRQFGVFVLYFTLQILLFNNITLFDMFTPHVFTLFLLMIPITLNFPLTILVAFFAGLLVDLFGFGLLTGLHAFSCVLMMSVRNLWVNVITNRIAFRGNEDVLLYIQPYPWYIQYMLPLILLHHLAYYILDAMGGGNLGMALAKAGGSAVYTFIWAMIFALLFYKSSKR